MEEKEVLLDGFTAKFKVTEGGFQDLGNDGK